MTRTNEADIDTAYVKEIYLAATSDQKRNYEQATEFRQRMNKAEKALFCSLVYDYYRKEIFSSIMTAVAELETE